MSIKEQLARRTRVVAWYTQGIGPTEIGRELNMTAVAVVQMARRAGCPPQSPSCAERGQLSAEKMRLKRREDERNDEKREMTRNKRATGLKYNISGGEVDRDALALIAKIPADTRDLTARFFGDPLPGRRAIDRRQPA